MKSEASASWDLAAEDSQEDLKASDLREAEEVAALEDQAFFLEEVLKLASD